MYRFIGRGEPVQGISLARLAYSKRLFVPFAFGL
jgi:hypothetical protein